MASLTTKFLLIALKFYLYVEDHQQSSCPHNQWDSFYPYISRFFSSLKKKEKTNKTLFFILLHPHNLPWYILLASLL